MKENSKDTQWIEDTWNMFLTTGGFMEEHRKRSFFKLLSSSGSHRCKICYAPFEGAGRHVVRVLYGKHQSNINPFLCNTCEDFARAHPGGAEIDLSLLFADVRGSTQLAEKMSTAEFHKLINRFYSTATNIMTDSDALIDKIIGDQAAAMYVPGFAGQQHARVAINAAIKILQATGHDSEAGPWIPLGVGVHTGPAFVGSLGTGNGVSDITVLGNTANTAARLSTSAGIGEILISNSAYQHANYGRSEILEQREVELKGKSSPMLVNVLSMDKEKRKPAL